MKGTIGIVFKDEAAQGLTQDFFASILEGFRQKCFEHEYNVAFLNTRTDRSSADTYLNQVRDNHYAGVLLASTDRDPGIEELLDNGIVTGSIDKDYANSYNISSDNSAGMHELMEYILEMGHRRIAIITGDNSLVSSIRLNEYLKSLESHGIQANSDYVVGGKFRDIDNTTYLTEKLLKLPVPPTCIIFSDDFAAIGGINAIRARGLSIPREISVAGYDGVTILSELEPRLTTVIQDTKKMGELVAERLIYGIENPDDRKFSTEVVPTRLQKGSSVGRVYQF